MRLAGFRKTLNWARSPGVLVPALLVAFVLFSQWPMLKGLAYRTFGIAAPKDNIAWRTDVSAAFAEAKSTGKPLLLDFSASWCPPCQAMKHDVWPDAQVGEAVAAGYIPIALDADDQSSEELARKYNVDTIPRIIVVDANGQVLKQEGYMSRRSMLEFLNKG